MSEPPHPWKDPQIRAARARLLAFFDEHRRDLPWRGEPDPYRIWVSEVMLQQTRVETVVPYYRRWMERFPTLEALSGASVDEVLRAWQGLGYYSRARNLHRAARELRADHDGTLPDTAPGLRALPGIGEYTAGAVASIAFGRAEPAVDGNVRRVLARLMDAPRPGAARLRRWAAGLVDADRPGDFNQALMELGARVCTPRDPTCDECPLGDMCAARAAGTQDERPAPRRRGSVPKRTELALVLHREGPDVLLRRRPPEGLLGGMWEVPSVAFDGNPSDTAAVHRTLRNLLRDLWPGGADVPPPADALVRLPSVEHAFSHRRMTYVPHVREAPTGPAATEPVDDCRWVPLAERDRVALPVAQQAILDSFEKSLSGGG